MKVSQLAPRLVADPICVGPEMPIWDYRRGFRSSRPFVLLCELIRMGLDRRMGEELCDRGRICPEDDEKKASSQSQVCARSVTVTEKIGAGAGALRPAAMVGATPHANLRFAKKICIIARKQRPPEIVAALRAGDTLSCAPPNQRSTTEGGASCQRWVWFCRVVGR